MIKYQRDYEKKYEKSIGMILRSHNEQFTNIKDYSSLYVYVLEGETLVGALKVSYFWDWSTIGNVFYKNQEVLKQLVKNAWDHYKEKAVGFKFFTSVKSRYDDFVSIGFKPSGIVKLGDIETYYYADLKSFDQDLKDAYEVIVSDEPVDHYQKELEAHTKTFNKEHKIEDASEIYDLAALDGEKCIGGLQAEVYNDMLYINRIAVDPNYRKQSIGKTLMIHAIDYAKDKGLPFVMLGTGEFQAKEFYEKVGFEAVYVREDNPKGYKMYTMLKSLK